MRSKLVSTMPQALDGVLCHVLGEERHVVSRSSSTRLEDVLEEASARSACRLRSAKAISGSIIQNSARWRLVLSSRPGRWARRCRPAQRAAVGLDVQLAAHRQEGLLAEEVLAKSTSPSVVRGGFISVQGRDAEQLAGALGVAGGDDGRVDPVEPFSWKKRWVAWARQLRTRVTAPKVLVRGRRWATSRRYSKLWRLGCTG
jgi:hypothetical protein